MKVKLLSKYVKAPEIKKDGDGGYDLYLPENIVISPKEITTIGMKIACEIPDGYCGLLAIRSSIATKYQLILQNPLIDSNYRGEIHLILINNTYANLAFAKDERLCSLVLFKIGTPKIEIVKKLSDSNRGEKWNGSSGR